MNLVPALLEEMSKGNAMVPHLTKFTLILLIMIKKIYMFMYSTLTGL